MVKAPEDLRINGIGQMLKGNSVKILDFAGLKNFNPTVQKSEG